MTTEEWTSKAALHVYDLPSGWRFTSRDIAVAVGEPPDPHQVGGLLASLHKRGWAFRVKRHGRWTTWERK